MNKIYAHELHSLRVNPVNLVNPVLLPAFFRLPPVYCRLPPAF